MEYRSKYTLFYNTQIPDERCTRFTLCCGNAICVNSARTIKMIFFENEHHARANMHTILCKSNLSQILRCRNRRFFVVMKMNLDTRILVYFWMAQNRYSLKVSNVVDRFLIEQTSFYKRVILTICNAFFWARNIHKWKFKMFKIVLYHIKTWNVTFIYLVKLIKLEFMNLIRLWLFFIYFKYNMLRYKSFVCVFFNIHYQ